MFLPAFYPGLEVRAGDRLELECVREAARDGVHPDYRVEGLVHTRPEPRPFRFSSAYVGEELGSTPFYRRLLADWS